MISPRRAPGERIHWQQRGGVLGCLLGDSLSEDQKVVRIGRNVLLIRELEALLHPAGELVGTGALVR